MPTYKTEHNLRSLGLDKASFHDFDVVASVAASTLITATQAILAVPFDCKIFRVSMAYTASTGTLATVQIAVGTGALGAVGAVDTNSPAGTVVFSAPVQLTAGAGIMQDFTPAVFDAIYQASNAALGVAAPVLTLRVATIAASTITNLKVCLGLKAISQHAQAAMIPTPAGNYGFDPSVI